jgi:hypothetical protein
LELAINIFLAIFGLGATLAAFGGDTWRKGNDKLVRRITHRGWVSLVCMSVAFIIGINKEINTHEKNEKKQIIESNLRNEANEKQKKIDDQVHLIAELQTQISHSQKQVSDSTKSLTQTTERLGDQQLSSIEAAFSMAVKAPREMDDWVVNLNGDYKQIIPSRHGSEMLLYRGDIFDYTFVPNRKPRKPRRPSNPHDISDEEYEDEMEDYENSISSGNLNSLRLVAGEWEYKLHEGKKDGSHRKSIRIYSEGPESMVATILNPKKMVDVKIKIFITSSDSTRGQKEFRRLILNSPFSEFAKQKYKVTVADILRMRENPSTTSRIISQLSQGSFVKVLQSSSGWTEAITPEGRQGWLSSDYLSDIE